MSLKNHVAKAKGQTDRVAYRIRQRRSTRASNAIHSRLTRVTSHVLGHSGKEQHIRKSCLRDLAVTRELYSGAQLRWHVHGTHVRALPTWLVAFTAATKTHENDKSDCRFSRSSAPSDAGALSADLGVAQTARIFELGHHNSEICPFSKLRLW